MLCVRVSCHIGYSFAVLGVVVFHDSLRCRRRGSHVTHEGKFTGTNIGTCYVLERKHGGAFATVSNAQDSNDMLTELPYIILRALAGYYTRYNSGKIKAAAEGATTYKVVLAQIDG